MILLSTLRGKLGVPNGLAHVKFAALPADQSVRLRSLKTSLHRSATWWLIPRIVLVGEPTLVISMGFLWGQWVHLIISGVNCPPLTIRGMNHQVLINQPMGIWDINGWDIKYLGVITHLLSGMKHQSWYDLWPLFAISLFRSIDDRS